MSTTSITSFIILESNIRSDIVGTVIRNTVLAGVIIAIFPSFIFHKKDMLKNSSTTPSQMEIALQSQQYQYILFGSLVLSFPTLTEFVLDWYFSMRPSNGTFIVMWTLLLAVIIPDVTLLVAVCPTNSIELVPSLWTISTLPCVGCTSFLLSIYGGEIWNSVSMILSLEIYMVFVLMSAYVPFLSLPIQNLYYNFLKSLLLGAATLIFSIPTMKWIIHLVSLKREQVQRDQVVCSFIIIAMIIFITVSWTILTVFGTPALVNRGPNYCTWITCCFTIYSFLLIIILGRLFRYDMSRLHERRERELDQKRTFVRYISHEIRTPLNTVAMGLHLLRRETSELLLTNGRDDTIDIITDLETSCASAVDILNDLLDYEKLEAGILHLESKLFSVRPFLDKCITSFHLAAREKNISLKLEFSDANAVCKGGGPLKLCEDNLDQRDGEMDPNPVSYEQLILYADPRKLCQVFRNLLSNSIKFTQPGGHVTVRVSLVHQGKEVNNTMKQRITIGKTVKLYPEISKAEKSHRFKLHIDVIDTGAGIAKENHDKLFHEFAQFNAGKLQDGKGSGLGLWIANRIVELHGGQISVYSGGEGAGSTFSVDLPAYPNKDAAKRTLALSGADLSINFSKIPNRSKIQSNTSVPVEDEKSEPWHATVMKDDAYINPYDEGELDNYSDDGAVEYFDKCLQEAAFYVAHETKKSQKNQPSHLQKRNYIRELSQKYLMAPDDTDIILTDTPVDVDPPLPFTTRKTNSVNPLSTPQLEEETLDKDASSKLSVAITQKRVLVVDDVASNRKMLGRLLEGHFSHIVLAEDGQKGVEKLKAALETNTSFDLILMDYQMPVMDGPTAAKIMREIGFTGPIFGVTGNALAADIQLFISHGANLVLTKPVNYQSLMKAITESL